MIELVVVSAIGAAIAGIASAFKVARKHRYRYLTERAIIEKADKKDLVEIAKSIFPVSPSEDGQEENKSKEDHGEPD